MMQESSAGTARPRDADQMCAARRGLFKLPRHLGVNDGGEGTPTVSFATTLGREEAQINLTGHSRNTSARGSPPPGPSRLTGRKGGAEEGNMSSKKYTGTNNTNTLKKCKVCKQREPQLGPEEVTLG